MAPKKIVELVTKGKTASVSKWLSGRKTPLPAAAVFELIGLANDEILAVLIEYVGRHSSLSNRLLTDALRQDEAVAERLLKGGLPIPRSAVAGAQNAAQLRTLAAHGWDPSTTNEPAQSPWMQWIYRDAEFYKTARELGAHPNAVALAKVLKGARLSLTVEALKPLIAGLDDSALNGTFEPIGGAISPLEVAATFSSAAVMKALLDAGASDEGVAIAGSAPEAEQKRSLIKGDGKRTLAHFARRDALPPAGDESVAMLTEGGLFGVKLGMSAENLAPLGFVEENEQKWTLGQVAVFCQGGEVTGALWSYTNDGVAEIVDALKAALEERHGPGNNGVWNIGAASISVQSREVYDLSQLELRLDPAKDASSGIQVDEEGVRKALETAFDDLVPDALPFRPDVGLVRIRDTQTRLLLKNSRGDSTIVDWEGPQLTSEGGLVAEFEEKICHSVATL